jgi:C-terminal processing protease CtpA/Prc
LVVIVDGDSGSSAEILAQTIKDKGLGTVIGQPTAAQVQSGVEVPLSNGGMVMVTVGLTFSPKGFDFTKPVEPDEKVAPPNPTILALESRDTQIDRAIEILSGH